MHSNLPNSILLHSKQWLRIHHRQWGGRASLAAPGRSLSTAVSNLQPLPSLNENHLSYVIRQNVNHMESLAPTVNVWNNQLTSGRLWSLKKPASRRPWAETMVNALCEEEGASKEAQCPAHRPLLGHQLQHLSRSGRPNDRWGQEGKPQTHKLLNGSFRSLAE